MLELPIKVVFTLEVATFACAADKTFLGFELYFKSESSTLISVLKTSFSEFTLLILASCDSKSTLESVEILAESSPAETLARSSSLESLETLAKSALGTLAMFSPLESLETLAVDKSFESATTESSISIADTEETKHNPISKTARSNVRFLTEIISPHILE